jgi:hypothetical protein
MHRFTLWITTAVLAFALGFGVLTFGLYLLVAAVPILTVAARSNARLIGTSGFFIGLGGAWLLARELAHRACDESTATLGQSGCGSPQEQTFQLISIVSTLAGIILLLVGLYRERRHRTERPSKPTKSRTPLAESRR